MPAIPGAGAVLMAAHAACGGREFAADIGGGRRFGRFRAEAGDDFDAPFAEQVQGSAADPAAEEYIGPLRDQPAGQEAGNVFGRRQFRNGFHRSGPGVALEHGELFTMTKMPRNLALDYWNQDAHPHRLLVWFKKFRRPPTRIQGASGTARRCEQFSTGTGHFWLSTATGVTA